MKHVIVVTPNFFPETGADQYERVGNLRQFKRLGFDVTVITKVRPDVQLPAIQSLASEIGVRLITVPYRYSNRVLSLRERCLKFLGKLRNLRYFDGAAYEYAESGIQRALASELERRRPDFVWFDYSYLWPLYHLVRTAGIPIVTRPINYEPTHVLEEEGRSLMSYVKYAFKRLSERVVVAESALIVALSPAEAAVYRALGAQRVAVVPLRGLPELIRERHDIRTREPLHVCFMGSTYSVGHNERALNLVTNVLAPRAERECPGSFIFHVSGARIPEKYLARFDGRSLIYEGYIGHDQFDVYLDQMDIALSPSPKRVGMQQKVYEPLCRGIPLIAPRVATGGYPLNHGEHFIAAETPDAYFEALLRLRDPSVRRALSEQSIRVSSTLFSAEASDERLQMALSTIA